MLTNRRLALRVGLTLILLAVLLAAVLLALPQLARPGVPTPGPVSQPPTFPAYPNGMFPTVVPPTGYPGQSTPIPTLDAGQLTEQAAHWQAYEATQQAWNTAGVLALTATYTPMPPGRYIDPFGHFETAWPAGWNAWNGGDPSGFMYFTNFTDPPGGGFPEGGVEVSLSAAWLPPGQALPAWVQAQRDAFAFSFDKNETISEVYPITIGAYAGLAFDWSGPDYPGAHLYAPIDDRNAFLVLVTPYTPATWETAQAVLSTLVLHAPPAP